MKKGEKISEYHRNIVIECNRSRRITDEYRKKLSDSHKGWVSPGTLANLRKMASDRIGTKYSEETRKKIGDSHRGVKCHFWQGGKTIAHRAIRNSLEYKLWREAVFKRDGYKCVLCLDSSHQGRGEKIILNADHIKPFYKFPELRFEVENGRTLCLPCHKKTDTWGRPKTI